MILGAQLASNRNTIVKHVKMGISVMISPVLSVNKAVFHVKVLARSANHVLKVIIRRVLLV